MKGLVKQPLLHFLLLGGLALAAQRAWPVTETLTVSSQAQVDEEILLREALKLGLEETDPVARDRLLRNIRFAFPERTMPDEEALRLAQRLGMPEQDAVVRRRLGIVMEKRIAGRVQITEAALRDYLARHEGRYQNPPRYRWRHLFFGGVDARNRAQAALQKLQVGQAPDAADAFLGGTEFASSSATDIQRILGLQSAQAIVNAAPGVWQEPLVSPYGLHLVLVQEKIPPPPVDWAVLRPQLAYALLPELEQAAVKAELQRLREQYRIEVLP